ncbi:MAG TPA: M14 family zinc carboxypeptidase, partial [Chloroflexia bacterium]|nr:M14 family zinc carboxypeptidase [Chloroflexia bacterium]
MADRYRKAAMALSLALFLMTLGMAPTTQVGAQRAPEPAAAPQAQTPPDGTPHYQGPYIWVLRVYFHDMAERDRLATELSAEEMETLGGYLTVLADASMLSHIQQRGLRYEIDQEGTTQLNNPNLFVPDGGPNTFYGGYKTVEEMQAYLAQYATNYPTLAQVVDIGDTWCKQQPGGCVLTSPALSWPGYDLLVMHITNQAIPGPKPVFWFETGIHSREIGTPEVAMRYIAHLLDNYDTDPDAHWLVDHNDIWVYPMVNPDGHHMVEYGGNNPSSIGQRKNANYTNGCTTWGNSSSQLGTDNNRNFPFLWNCCGGSSPAPCAQDYHGPSGGSDPETQAIINQIRLLIPDQRGPNNTDPAPITTTGVYQSMHSSASLNLFPWGWTTVDAPNDAELRNIGKHMQATNAYPSGNSYTAGQPPELLYAVDGDTADWGYGELGAASYTTEIGGGSFYPAYTTIDSTIWPLNRGALLYQAKVARQPYLLAHGPDAAGVATNPMTVTQGMPSVISGTINFAWTGNVLAQNVGGAEYYIDTPPWAGGTAVPLAGSFGGSQTVLASATIDTTGLSVGRHIIFVRGRGVNQYQSLDTWGPITAAWLWVTPTGGITPTPLPSATVVPPTVTVPAATATLPAPSSTTTSVPVGSATVVPSATSTAGVATMTPCPVQFTDVPPTDPFYPFIRCLVCRGIISGYADNTFRGGNNLTRGQAAKIISNAAGFSDAVPSTQQSFEDVPMSDPFWVYIERLATRGYISGYQCGFPPAGNCVPPANRPYFLTYNSITRGQIAKIVANSAGLNNAIPSTQQTFTDV